MHRYKPPMAFMAVNKSLLLRKGGQEVKDIFGELLAIPLIHLHISALIA